MFQINVDSARGREAGPAEFLSSICSSFMN
jgi:hypothetical protein